MSINNQLISQKFNNYNYAPGIATYGIDGKTGKSGEDGNNIYFTDYIIDDVEGADDLIELVSKILNNQLPLKGDNTNISREYKDDDLFFDHNGVIYKLKNIDKIKSETHIESYSDIFSVAGKIKLNSDVNNSIFKFSGDSNRLILNERFNGYDIITGVKTNDVSNYINKDAVTNIISGHINENDNIEMLKLMSIDNIDIEDGNLSVYYKTTDNAYYIDSNKPIIINGDLKLNNNDNSIGADYDNFSSVLTSNDTITYFKNICDNLCYNVLYDASVNIYKIHIYSTDPTEIDESQQYNTLKYLCNRNETVYGKIYTADNEQILVKLENIKKDVVSSSDYTVYKRDIDIETPVGDDIVLNDFIFKFIRQRLDYYTPSDIYLHTCSSDKIHVLYDPTTYTIDISINDNFSSNNSVYVNDPGELGDEGEGNEGNEDDPYAGEGNEVSAPSRGRDADMASEILNLTQYGPFILSSKMIGIGVQYDSDISTYQIIVNPFNIPNSSSLSNYILHSSKRHDFQDNGTYSYSFIAKQNNDNIIKFSAYPLMSINDDSNEYALNNFNNPPIQIKLHISTQLLMNKKYTVYFSINYSSDKLSIQNILISERDDLLNIDEDIEAYNIEAEIPKTVKSIAKFSLLHNTEIFLQQQT